MDLFNKKKLEQLQASIDELKKIIETNELGRLREESKELKQIKELLSHVRFKVKDVKAFDDEELGKTDIRITYQLPVITLIQDEKGNVTKNNFFYSTNMLDMIDIEDMKKIQDVLDKERNKKNKN